MGAFSSKKSGKGRIRRDQDSQHSDDDNLINMPESSDVKLRKGNENVMVPKILTGSKQEHTAIINKQNRLESNPDEVTLDQSSVLAGRTAMISCANKNIFIIQKYKVHLESPNCYHICIFENIIYVTDSLYGTVKCFDAENGDSLGSITLSSASKDLTGIAVLRVSETELVMIVGDNIKRKLLACKLLTLTSIDTNECHFGTFKEICGLATDNMSRIFVADVTQGKVFIYRIDEGLTFELIYEINDQLDFPWYLCYDSVNERLLVSEPPEKRITVFTENGEFLYQLSHNDLHMTQPYGVAVDLEGGILVTDRQEHVIVKLDNDYVDVVERIKNDYQTSRMFNGPFDICVTQNGHLVVLDFNGSRDQYKRIQGFEIVSYRETDEIKTGRESNCSCFLDIGEQEGPSV